jgi:hypothetical protein
MQYTQSKHAQKPPGASAIGTGWSGQDIGCIGTGLPNGTAATTGAPQSPAGTVKTGCTAMFSTFLDASLAASSAAFLAFFFAFSC